VAWAWPSTGADVDWKDPKPAPGPLAVVQGFVNTANRMHDQDELRTSARALTALAMLGLVDEVGHIDEADRHRIIAFREALRHVLLAHHADGVDMAPAAESLNTAIGNVAMRPRLSPEGRPTMSPSADGSPADQAIGAVFGAIITADASGIWRRLKACRNGACHWAFYDASRNRSGRWCDMNVCGVRDKMRTYRRRHR
jgi:predicted RNA-binding Zn ribbon-like protein